MSELLMSVPDYGRLAVVVLVAQQCLWQLYDAQVVVPVAERVRVSEAHPLRAAAVQGAIRGQVRIHPDIDFLRDPKPILRESGLLQLLSNGADVHPLNHHGATLLLPLLEHLQLLELSLLVLLLPQVDGRVRAIGLCRIHLLVHLLIPFGGNELLKGLRGYGQMVRPLTHQEVHGDELVLQALADAPQGGGAVGLRPIAAFLEAHVTLARMTSVPKSLAICNRLQVNVVG
jgi:hypothetical protein